MREPTADTLALGTSLALALIVSALHYAVFRLIYRFADIYQEFDGDLPGITRLLLESPIIYWIWPVLVTVCLLLHHAGQVSRRLALGFATIGTGVTTFLCVVALYLPYFQLGSLVVD